MSKLKYVIHTERLRIRPVGRSDADFLIVLVNSEGWLKFIGDRNLHTKKQAEDYIEKISGIPDFHYNIIELKNSLVPVGIISFILRENNDHPDLGFALLPRFTGNGYAEEASRGYLQEVFKQHPDLKVLAITKHNNDKSIQLIEKLGFSFESARTKDGIEERIYSIRKS